MQLTVQARPVQAWWTSIGAPRKLSLTELDSLRLSWPLKAYLHDRAAWWQGGCGWTKMPLQRRDA